MRGHAGGTLGGAQKRDRTIGGGVAPKIARSVSQVLILEGQGKKKHGGTGGVYLYLGAVQYEIKRSEGQHAGTESLMRPWGLKTMKPSESFKGAGH